MKKESRERNFSAYFFAVSIYLATFAHDFMKDVAE